MFCMCVCVCVGVCACVCPFVSVCLFVHVMCVCVHACLTANPSDCLLHTDLCTCVFVFVCVRVCAPVSVTDADLEVEGVPVAPLDVRCHDANKDYVVVTWKQPAVEGSSPILGYFIDKWVAPPSL